MSDKMEGSNEDGWNIDDSGEWDDWGDAEDNISETSLAKSDKIENRDMIIKSENNLEKYTCHPERQLMPSRQCSGWGGLLGGVVSSMLNTATELTTTVSHGIDKVIGVPDPAELARINAKEEAQSKEKQHIEQIQNEEELHVPPSTSVPVFGFGLVNNVTSLGSKVLNTGLDTLEGIGKKTMDMLQENDPLLKNKIKKLGMEQDKPNLSEILKEAKEENEQLEQSLRELSLEKTRAQLRFDLLFENNCGLVHLEALEILSKESQLKLQTLKESVSGKALEDLMETIDEVKELVELEDLEDEPENEQYSKKELEENLKRAIEDTGLQIKFDDISELWANCTTWLSNEETKNVDAQTLFAKGITSLAMTCSLQMLKLHKLAELLLVKEHHSTANEVDGISQLCKQFCLHLQIVANAFATHLSTHADQNVAKNNINTLFAEMLQGRQLIEKGFKLFLPILQIGAV